MTLGNRFGVLASLDEEDSVKELIHRPAERTRVRDYISPRTPTGVVAEFVSARNPPQVSVAKNSRNLLGEGFEALKLAKQGRSILTKEEIYTIEQWLIKCGYQTQVDDLKKEAKDERRSFDKCAGVRDVGKESLKVFSSTKTETKIEDEAEEKGNKFGVLASLDEKDSVKELIHRPAERTRVRDCISPRTPTRVVAEFVSARNPPQVSVAKNSRNLLGEGFEALKLAKQGRSILTKEEIYTIEQWLIKCGYQTQVDDLKKEAKDERRSFDKCAGVRDVGKESLKVFSSTKTETKIEDEAEEKGCLLADGIKSDSGEDETVSEGEELESEIATDEESKDEFKEEQGTIPNQDPCSSEVRLFAPNVDSFASSHPFLVNVVEISHPLRMDGDRIL
ncbi:hypothetical protein U1Q18_037791 [Sarracenia purpurea var. burkii]